jgi:large subunit ribosomal protein L3
VHDEVDKMSIGLVGRKSGMTRVFTEDGVSIPVTVVEVPPNRVTQIKTPENDGYSAIQVTTGARRASRVSKALAGHFAKANTEAGEGLWEFRTEAGDTSELTQGSEFKVDVFEEGQKVDVTGISKGKGFQGGVKRHNFQMQDATHGNSLSHRAPGSIGQCQTPGRVWKGKKMAGQMGNVRQTTQSLEVIRVDLDNNLLLIKGALPGATGSKVVVRPAVKVRGK